MGSQQNDVIDLENDEDDGTIPELDGFSAQPEKMLKLSVSQTQSKPVEFVRPPVIPCVYTDPDTKHDMCLVVLVFFNGVKNISFDLIQQNDGPEPTLKITYHWPSTMYDVGSMFKNDKDKTMLFAKYHPKVLAVDNALKLYRENIEDAPVGHIQVKLPVEVQMDPKTWIKNYNKKSDGSVIVFFEFICIRRDYVITKTEKSLSFD